ncbi:MAG: ABC transporter permease subunit, partial [Burkholderiales bacterium]|nr:ABC transporter permease subunit [Burkholderiales bacterium]
MRLSLRDARFRALVFQVLALGAVLAALAYLVSNTVANLEERKIASGFGFLAREAGFAIGETTFIAYSAADSYLRALAVGLANTFRVGLIGIVLATVLGTLVGLARLSSNWLVGRLAALYVEVLRNVPLLVQLFFWYAVISENLPGPRAALNPLPGVFLSNRGIAVPTLIAEAAHAWVLGAFALVFVWLALSMFGFYDLQLPGFLHHRLHSAHRRLEGGRIASVAAMGVFSAVIVSPCVAAPLAGALLYISQTKDVVLGGGALFSMALGMGVPL